MSMMKILIPVILGLSMLGCFQAAEPQNIVLVTVDTLRADNLRCYGYPVSTSPNVDALAAMGVLYENCMAHASSTCPALASILTGIYPSETGVICNAWPVHRSMETIARKLKDEGYRTAAFVSNFNLRPRMGFNIGFDVYDARFNEKETNRPGYVERTAVKTTDAALEWLDRMALRDDKPFFMWIHYQDPHGPYTPPESLIPESDHYDAFDRTLDVRKDNQGLDGIPAYQVLDDRRDDRFYRKRYDGEIVYFDKHFARLYRHMDDAGLFEKTAMIFTADHGESMGEHGYWYCHEQDLYNELIHVPLIITAPGLAPGRCESRVCHMDLFPTMLALSGETGLSGYRGKNLLDLPALAEDRPIYSETFNLETETAYRSMIMGPWKLVRSPDASLPPLLFNLDEDPDEMNNLFDAQADKANEMIALLKAHEKIARSGKKTKSILVTPQEKQILNALGYASK